MINALRSFDILHLWLSLIVESAKILKSLRELSGLSVSELAEKARISRSYVYKIEGNPDSSPTIDTVKSWIAATKPYCEPQDWLNLSLRLILDEKSVNDVEVMIEETQYQELQAVKLIKRLMPMRFLNSLKRR